MSTTTERPDLSALPREVRVRIAVAEAIGARWDFGRWSAGEQMWVLQFPGRSFHDVSAYVYANGQVDYEHAGDLHDYLTDPAAWGALMEKEDVSVVKTPRGYDAWCPQQGWADSASTRGEAVVRAVLRRHGVGPDTLEPVR